MRKIGVLYAITMMVEITAKLLLNSERMLKPSTLSATEN